MKYETLKRIGLSIGINFALAAQAFGEPAIDTLVFSPPFVSNKGCDFINTNLRNGLLRARVHSVDSNDPIFNRPPHMIMFIIKRHQGGILSGEQIKPYRIGNEFAVTFDFATGFITEYPPEMGIGEITGEVTKMTGGTTSFGGDYNLNPSTLKTKDYAQKLLTACRNALVR